MSISPRGGSRGEALAAVDQARSTARGAWRAGAGAPIGGDAPRAALRHREIDLLAEVLRAKREPLLRAYAAHLRREDLEDCYSQAALELLLRVRRRQGFASRAHVANALEQKLRSRIADRARALAGRSPSAAALEGSLRCVQPGAYLEVADRSAQVEELVLNRLRLEEIIAQAPKLSEEQRFALACRVGLQLRPGALQALCGWSTHKERKLVQRARLKLRALVDESEGGEQAARA